MFKQSRKSKSNTKTKSVKKIVKVRTVAKKRYKRKKNNNGLSSGLRTLVRYVAPIGYGYIRESISDKIAESEIGKKLPASQFTDEGVMLVTNMILSKVGLNKIPVARSVLRAGKDVELARIGRTMKDMRDLKQGTTTRTVAGNSFR